MKDENSSYYSTKPQNYLNSKNFVSRDSFTDKSLKLYQILHRFILCNFSFLFLLYKFCFQNFIVCIIFLNLNPKYKTVVV